MFKKKMVKIAGSTAIKNFTSGFIIFCVFLFNSPQLISATEGVVEDTLRRDSVKVVRFESKKSPIQRVLALPRDVWTLAYYPLGKFVIWGERVRVDQRVLNFLLTEDRTAGVLPLATVGGNTGISIGAVLFDNDILSKDISLSGYGIFGSRANFTVASSIVVPVLGEGNKLSFSSKVWKDNEEFIYGGENGNSSLVDDSLAYGIRDSYVNAELFINWKKPSGRFLLTNYQRERKRGRENHFSTILFVKFSEVTIDVGEADYKTVPDSILGFGKTNLFETGLVLSIDTRNHEFNPRTGGLLRLTGMFSDQTDGEFFQFYRYTIEFQRYVELFKRHRVLGFRLILDETHTPDNKSIPFYRMSILGSHETLRGYREGRFRDFGSILLNFDYRYPIWDTFEGVIFIDTGQVFRNFGDMSLSSFHTGYGVGTRFRTPTGFLARFQAGFSKEGSRVLLQFTQIFN